MSTTRWARSAVPPRWRSSWFAARRSEQSRFDSTAAQPMKPPRTGPSTRPLRLLLFSENLDRAPQLNVGHRRHLRWVEVPDLGRIQRNLVDWHRHGLVGVDATAEDQVSVRGQPALDGQTNRRAVREVEVEQDGAGSERGVAHQLSATG